MTGDIAYGRLTGRPLFFDRQGHPLSIEDAEAHFADPDYTLVARDAFVSGIALSTIWLGCNFNFGGDPPAPPIIFETAVITPGGDHAVVDRYASESAAQIGHQVAVQVVLDSGDKLHVPAGPPINPAEFTLGSADPIGDK